MFFISGLYLKQTLSIKVLYLMSYIYAEPSLLVATTFVKSLEISTPVTGRVGPAGNSI